MDQELERIANSFRDARDPEDLLGVEPIVLPRGVQLERRRKVYDGLKAITSLEYLSPEDNEVARDLDRRLEDTYQQAQARIEIGAYNLQGRGQPIPVIYRSRSFDSGRKRYTIGSRYRQGQETTLYNGYLEVDGILLGEVLLKVAKSPAESPFVEREANVLGLLRKEEYREIDYLPCPLDRFESGGRMGLAMRRLDGFNLREVRQVDRHRAGLDPRDMVWMLSRTLAVMGMAHQYGVIHGRICPDHILIEPATHLGMVVGWGGSAIAPARSGERVLAPVPTFSAPEAAGPTAGPWSDTYSIGKTYIWALGGDPESNHLPERVEGKLAELLQTMVCEDHFARPEDCWQLFETLERLKVELWGEKKWRRLDMPPPRTVS